MGNNQPKKEKKIPMRHCLGCNAQAPKSELVRVVRTPEGTVVLDFTGRKAGRGAYLCKKADCLKKAKKAQRLQRSLECEIPEEVFASLEEELSSDE